MWSQLPKKKSWGTKIDIKHMHTCRQRSNQDFSPAEQNKTSAGDLWDGGGGGGGYPSPLAVSGGAPKNWHWWLFGNSKANFLFIVLFQWTIGLTKLSYRSAIFNGRKVSKGKWKAKCMHNSNEKDDRGVRGAWWCHIKWESRSVRKHLILNYSRHLPDTSFTGTCDQTETSIFTCKESRLVCWSTYAKLGKSIMTKNYFCEDFNFSQCGFRRSRAEAQSSQRRTEKSYFSQADLKQSKVLTMNFMSDFYNCSTAHEYTQRAYAFFLFVRRQPPHIGLFITRTTKHLARYWDVSGAARPTNDFLLKPNRLCCSFRSCSFLFA